MPIDWGSLEAIAASRRIDAWVLVPTGQAINRMLRKDSNIPASWRARFDKFFGDPGWSDRLYSPSPDLFNDEHAERAAIKDIERYVIERLRTIFPPPAVHSTGLRLVRQSHPQFLLAFACANPEPVAYSLALKAANFLIERAQRS